MLLLLEKYRSVRLFLRAVLCAAPLTALIWKPHGYFECFEIGAGMETDASPCGQASHSEVSRTVLRRCVPIRLQSRNRGRFRGRRRGGFSNPMPSSGGSGHCLVLPFPRRAVWKSYRRFLPPPPCLVKSGRRKPSRLRGCKLWATGLWRNETPFISVPAAGSKARWKMSPRSGIYIKRPPVRHRAFLPSLPRAAGRLPFPPKGRTGGSV